MIKISKLKDLTGQRFGKLTALYRIHNYHKKRVHWLCICDCGNLAEVASCNLQSQTTNSCGCLYQEHGKSHDRLYKLYYNIKDRCYNKNSTSYKDYGARDIKVCQEWLDDFMNFYNWAINNGYREGLTIDRIDNDKGHSPDNCRCATNKEQIRNRRNTKYVTYKGETKPLAEWCEILNLNYDTVQSRLRYSWPVDRALELK